MAAARAHCTNCGEPFDRRAVNQSYCFADECRKARNRENVRAFRETRAVLDAAEARAWARRQVAA